MHHLPDPVSQAMSEIFEAISWIEQAADDTQSLLHSAGARLIPIEVQLKLLDVNLESMEAVSEVRRHLGVHAPSQATRP